MTMLKKTLSYLLLRYFRLLAKLQLQKNPRATYIGITGSAGKTSASTALVQILKTRGPVKYSSHANSESGIPLNILGLSPRTYSVLDWLRLIILAPWRLLTYYPRFNYYVIEMGIDGPDSPKNMGYLLSIIRPHLAVVLNVGLTHSGSFDYLVKDVDPLRRRLKLIQLIAKEKIRLAHGVRPGGIAVINLDQKELLAAHSTPSARQITFGYAKQADLRITKVSVTRRGFTLRFTYQTHSYTLTLPVILAKHYAYTFAAAISAACALGIPPTLSLSALADYRSPAGRLRLFPGISSSTIIDSSYNASPTTMLESLTLLKQLAGSRLKIAVIGDMRELGQSSKLAHKNLADWLMSYSDQVILYGQLTHAHTLPLLLSKNFPVRHFFRMTDLSQYLRTVVKPKSYVLVKGSQNELFMERAVEAILANPADLSQLCRRGPYWDRLRAKTP